MFRFRVYQSIIFLKKVPKLEKKNTVNNTNVSYKWICKKYKFVLLRKQCRLIIITVLPLYRYPIITWFGTKINISTYIWFLFKQNKNSFVIWMSVSLRVQIHSFILAPNYYLLMGIQFSVFQDTVLIIFMFLYYWFVLLVILSVFFAYPSILSKQFPYKIGLD